MEVENNYDEPEQFAEIFFNLLQKERKIGGKWLKQLQMNSFFNPFAGKQ